MADQRFRVLAHRDRESFEHDEGGLHLCEGAFDGRERLAVRIVRMDGGDVHRDTIRARRDEALDTIAEALNLGRLAA